MKKKHSPIGQHLIGIKLWLVGFLVLVSFGALSTLKLNAQVATASINGVVRDSTGAVIPSATVLLTNVATNVTQKTTSDSTGVYVLLNIPAGNYTLTVSKTGFQTKTQSQFTLNVNQTTSFDFVLAVGATHQVVTVSAGASAMLQTSTSNLGTNITTTQVNDLPLNGRNFTQLLALTPGVSTRNTSQNSGGFNTNPTGIFVVPAVNGQTNRSNFFMLDGLNDQEVFNSTYTIQPIVDDIQQFKVVSHTDSAQFGGSLGGIINVVTKSGTNSFHGAGWEYLRNSAFDARSPFSTTVSPLRQNQFGANIGGPVLLPHYNGRNKTFFFASYEGTRIHTQSQGLGLIPTPAELNGDFSGLVDSSGNQIPIYDPFSTRADPNNPGALLRDQFPNNQIPSNMIDQNMLAVAQMEYPQPFNTGIAGTNYQRFYSNIHDVNTYHIRGDEQLGSRDAIWGEFFHISAPATSGNTLPGFTSSTDYHAYVAGGAWIHTFNPSTVLEVQMGRNYGFESQPSTNTNLQLNDVLSAGNFAPAFTCGFNYGPQKCYLGGLGLSGYLNAGWGFNATALSNDWEWRGTFSKIMGRHTFTAGADLNYNTFESPLQGASVGFSSFQTSNLETGSGGDSLASFLLGVPDSGGRRNVHETLHDGWVNGFSFQDQWKTTDRLTINMGIRYDYTLVPWYGQQSDRSWSSGDLNLNNGTYVIEHNAPACSATVFAPCIPGGTLPAHVVVSPNGKIIQSNFDNIQPRLGIAYRLGKKTVLRVSGGRFFDNWAGVFQMAQNFEGAWPDIGQLLAQNLNQGVPNVPAENPFLLTSGGYPAPTPFNQVQWFMNPNIQNPESWQWNFGIQRQLSQSTTVEANYVGSASTRTDVGGFNNTAVTPGPGDPQSRAPYPYIAPTFYDRSIGRATYNAFQFSLNHRWHGGLSYLVSYTFSRAMDLGSDGWFGVESTFVPDPYNVAQSWSAAGYDVPQSLSVSWNYDVPVGQGKQFNLHNSALNYVVGNWRLNGILNLTSGYPYTITAPSGIPNTGTAWESGYQISANSGVSNPSPEQWFNTAAFTSPAEYTWGNVGRNSMRSDWKRGLDFSIFREFPITENKRFEFRADAFNVTNTPVWGFPHSSVTDSNFGRIFGTNSTSRELQFALKLYF